MRLALRSLTNPARPNQTIEMTDAWSPSGNFQLVAVDLNFDTVMDVGVGAALATPNESLDYWLVDGAGGGWRYLGRYSNLRVDAHARQLTTYEKGGHGGLLYESRTYEWKDGHMVLMRSISRAEAPEGGGYVETTRTFDSGRMIREVTRPVDGRE